MYCSWNVHGALQLDQIQSTILKDALLFTSITLKFRSLPVNIQILCFFVTLLALVADGLLFPSLGVLVVGLILGLAVEVTRLRYHKHVIATTLIMFSTLTLLWGWFGPHIGVFARPIALVMFLAWGAFCIKAPINASLKFGSLSFFSILSLSIIVFIQDANHLISPLLWGYDNNAHIPALSQVYRHGGFLYSGHIPELFTFSNYVNGYPPLQSSTWAFVMSIANSSVTGGYEILSYFSFFFFGTGILIAYLITANWKAGLPDWLSRWHAIFLTAIFFVLVLFSPVSSVFWSGFPPFLWAAALIIAVSALIDSANGHLSRISLAYLGLVLVSYSYPLLSPVAAVVLLFELLHYKSALLEISKNGKWKTIFLAVSGAILLLAVVLKSLNVRRYLFDDGGIQAVPIFNLGVVFAAVALLLIFAKSKIRSTPSIVIAFVASCINFYLLARLSQQHQNFVSYYPQKAGFLCLILGYAALGKAMLRKSQRTNTRFDRTIQFVSIMLTIAVVWYPVNPKLNPNYKELEYVSTHEVWRQLRANPSNKVRDCFIDAMEITADLNSNSSTKTILYLQDDLSTRWINGVRGRLTDATYSLSITVGQASQSLTEILDTWFGLYPRVRLVVLAPEPPLGLEKWGNKIEYRQFNCVLDS